MNITKVPAKINQPRLNPLQDDDLSDLTKKEILFWSRKLQLTPSELFTLSEEELESHLTALNKEEQDDNERQWRLKRWHQLVAMKQDLLQQQQQDQQQEKQRQQQEQQKEEIEQEQQRRLEGGANLAEILEQAQREVFGISLEDSMESGCYSAQSSRPDETYDVPVNRDSILTTADSGLGESSEFIEASSATPAFEPSVPDSNVSGHGANVSSRGSLNFCPNLASTPKRGTPGRRPTFRNYTDYTLEYSALGTREKTQSIAIDHYSDRSADVRGTLRSCFRPNRSFAPNRTFDAGRPAIGGGGSNITRSYAPDPSYCVPGGDPNVMYNVPGCGQNAIAAGAANATFVAPCAPANATYNAQAAGAANATYQVPCAPGNATFNVPPVEVVSPTSDAGNACAPSPVIPSAPNNSLNVPNMTRPGLFYPQLLLGQNITPSATFTTPDGAIIQRTNISYRLPPQSGLIRPGCFPAEFYSSSAWPRPSLANTPAGRMPSRIPRASGIPAPATCIPQRGLLRPPSAARATIARGMMARGAIPRMTVARGAIPRATIARGPIARAPRIRSCPNRNAGNSYMLGIPSGARASLCPPRCPRDGSYRMSGGATTVSFAPMNEGSCTNVRRTQSAQSQRDWYLDGLQSDDQNNVAGLDKYSGASTYVPFSSTNPVSTTNEKTTQLGSYERIHLGRQSGGDDDINPKISSPSLLSPLIKSATLLGSYEKNFVTHKLDVESRKGVEAREKSSGEENENRVRIIFPKSINCDDSGFNSETNMSFIP